MGTPAAPPWRDSRTRSRYLAHDRSPWEWLPRPHLGRSFTTGSRMSDDETIYVQVVPGPQRLYQIVRVDLASPVARGFRTRQEASEWIAKAVKQGVLPKGVVEVEPGP